MMESSRYDLAEEEDAGPSSNDVEKMLDGFVMERDDAAAAAELHTFNDAMTPEIDENLPWWQSVLFFLACGEPGSAPGKQPEPGLSDAVTEGNLEKRNYDAPPDLERRAQSDAPSTSPSAASNRSNSADSMAI